MYQNEGSPPSFLGASLLTLGPGVYTVLMKLSIQSKDVVTSECYFARSRSGLTIEAGAEKSEVIEPVPQYFIMHLDPALTG